MHQRILIIGVTAVGLAISVRSASPQTSTTPAASSTATSVGTAVGTGISAVLSAAFPAAATIINAIWPKPSEKKTASQAQQPVTQLQKTSAVQIQQLSADLDTVNVFLVDCVMADRSVIKMQAILGKNTTISGEDQLKLKSNWNEASPRILELGKDTAKAAANAVSDEYIKRSLLAISETNYGGLTNILDDINNKSADDLRDRLANLEPKLAGVAALSGDIVGQVSSGLHAAAKNMVPAQGPTDEAEKAFARRLQESHEHYETILNDVYGVVPRRTQP